MTFTLGLTQIIYIIGLLLYVVVFFVGAAYGKRVGMKGGTIKGTLRKTMKKELSEFDDKAQEEFKKGREAIKKKYAEMKD